MYFLKYAFLQIPRKLLKTAFGIINTHWVMRSLDFRKGRSLNCFWWFLITIPITILMYIIGIEAIRLHFYSRNSSSTTNGTVQMFSLVMILVFIILVAASWQFFIFCIPNLCSLKKVCKHNIVST